MLGALFVWVLVPAMCSWSCQSLSCLFNFGKRNKSQGSKSVEYDGWGMIEQVDFHNENAMNCFVTNIGIYFLLIHEYSCHFMFRTTESIAGMANILANFSNSYSTLLYNNFLHCFIDCWRAGVSTWEIVIYIFSPPPVKSLNHFFAQSRLTKCPN